MYCVLGMPMLLRLVLPPLRDSVYRGNLFLVIVAPSFTSNNLELVKFDEIFYFGSVLQVRVWGAPKAELQIQLWRVT